MEALFTPQFKWLWTLLLAIALFFPVRHLIWVLTVRRAVAKGGADNVSASEQARLKRRAGFTSALLCVLFALFYVGRLFSP